MSDLRIPQNPGIGGLKEFTDAETTFLQDLVANGGGGSQTPWTSDINGGGYTLSNMPLLVGGTTTTSSLTFKTTTGVGTTGADHIFLVGNNGATEAMRISNNGYVGIGTSSALTKFHLQENTANSSGVLGIGTIGLSSSSASPVANGFGWSLAGQLEAADGIVYGTGSFGNYWVNSGASKTTGWVWTTRAGATMNFLDTALQVSMAGTASAPAYSWSSDTNTGMWRVTADQLGFATGGANRLTISSTAITSQVYITAPSFKAYNSTDSVYTELTYVPGSGGGGIYGGGNLYLNTNTGQTALTNIYLQAGTSTSFVGGNISRQAGESSATATAGGSIYDVGGHSYDGDGGFIGLAGGVSDVTNGGYISLVGGTGMSQSGGYIQIFGGDGNLGGSVDIRGGYSNQDYTYSPVYLQSNGGITNISATSFVVDSYGGQIYSNVSHGFYSDIRTPSMPTSDPMDGSGTLWYDTGSNIVYRGT